MSHHTTSENCITVSAQLIWLFKYTFVTYL